MEKLVKTPDAVRSPATLKTETRTPHLVFRYIDNDFDHTCPAALTCRQSPLRIPHLQLSPAALRAVVEEFVTRDGTDHSSVEQRIAGVLRQLDDGAVELHFEQETKTCNILPTDRDRNPLTE